MTDDTTTSLDLDDFRSDRPDLSAVWDTLDSPVMYWLDENGVNMGNACVRHLAEDTWLYSDDADGFRLIDESEIDADALCTEDDPRRQWGYSTSGEVVKH